MASTPIGELAQTSGFRGTPNHRIAEAKTVSTLPIIDNTEPRSPAVRTSVDCYVSGQYVQRNGKIIEVTQRYTIFVGYSRQTQLQTMEQVRSRITMDFEAKYGKTFNVTTVHVPALPIPAEKTKTQEEQFYGGSTLYREMTRYEKARYDIGTERLKETTNVRSIKRRYGLR